MIIKSFSELEKIDGELIKIPCSGLSIDKQFELVWNAYQGLLDFHGESVSRTVTVVPSECHVEFNKESKEMLPHWQDMHLTLGKHIRIALGGTFDRLHFGHKVLLTLGLMLCRESSGRLIVGVTSDEMAKERKLSSRLLEPYHLRIEKLQAFFDIFEFSEYEIIKLDDPYGPTITDSSIDALVVTDETVSTSRKRKMNQEDTRRHLLASFVKYLSEEGLIGLDDEQRASVEIAVQCLQSVYGTDSVPASQVPDLKALFAHLKQPLSEEQLFERREQAEIIKNEGNRLLMAGNKKEAIEQYKQAIALDPENAIFHANLAAGYMALESYDLAAKAAQDAIDLDPGYAKAWARLGNALKHLKRVTEARNAFEEALRLDPGLDLARKGLDSLSASPTASNDSLGGGMGGLADMMKGVDLNKLMSDPNFMQMANQMMQSGALNDIFKDPSTLNAVKKNMKR